MLQTMWIKKLVVKIKNMDNSIIPLKISQLANLIAQNKHIPVSAALSYIYDSPFYEQLYDENAKWWYLDTVSLYREIERAKVQQPIKVSNSNVIFLTFCIERYARKHKLSALQSYALFRRYKVDYYLIDGFDVLHTQSEETIIRDIDIYLQNHSRR